MNTDRETLEKFFVTDEEWEVLEELLNRSEKMNEKLKQLMDSKSPWDEEE